MYYSVNEDVKILACTWVVSNFRKLLIPFFFSALAADGWHCKKKNKIFTSQVLTCILPFISLQRRFLIWLTLNMKNLFFFSISYKSSYKPQSWWTFFYCFFHFSSEKVSKLLPFHLPGQISLTHFSLEIARCKLSSILIVSSLQQYHIETVVPIWSPMFSNVKLSQYLNDWLLRNTMYCKQKQDTKPVGYGASNFIQ